MTLSPSIQNELAHWLPKSRLAWFAAVLACTVLGNLMWMAGVTAYDTLAFDNRPIASITDFRPPVVTIRQGEPATISWLYTKRENCDATGTFAVTPRNGESKSYTFGPQVASLPATDTPKWHTVTVEIGSGTIPPGEYFLTFYTSGSCKGSETERPSNKQLYHNGPLVPLVILPAENA